MSDTGITRPGTAVNDTGVGSNAWSNASNVTTGGAATVNTSRFNKITNYLWCTNYGFDADIGASDTIDGVEASVTRQDAGGGGDAYDYEVRLVVAGAVAGDNKADTATAYGGSATVTYGGSADDWNVSGGLSASDVRATDFGLALACQQKNTSLGGAIGCTEMRLTVYYTEAATGAAKTAIITALMNSGRVI